MVCKRCGQRSKKATCPKCLKEVQRLKKLNTKAYQAKEFKRLHAKAWKLFSLYVRSKGAKNGYNSCYTCGKVSLVSELQAGHFHHGRLDFDERNIHPQCPQCNTYKSGNLAIYATRLADELGEGGLRLLLLDANTKIYTKAELEKIIQKLSV